MIYSIVGYNQSALVSLETGHIVSFNIKEPKKSRFIIDGHLGAVIRSVYASFNREKIISVSNDLSFAIWDNLKRDSTKAPAFVKRIEIKEKPNWIETLQS